MSPDMVFEESNVRFNFSGAVWATKSLHDHYRICSNSLLKDVDFIVETQGEIFFVEIKNSAYAGARCPEVFEGEKIKTDKHCQDIAGKYYHSVLYPLVSRKEKKYIYLYVLETTSRVDRTSRKLIRDKIIKYLPRKFPCMPEGSKSLIDEFDIVSIDEWNRKYSQYPITRLY
ncbi:hypothetical protein [Methanorbis furvi]|uniref:Uncharacterized protein n=1 Tax=Methanorbis furvi TaxID=3028299 RepID=A0AAE4MC95_9EURY|nr:hypothetical protein [Methanocorpusculaceae archaeon Ag1]